LGVGHGGQAIVRPPESASQAERHFSVAIPPEESEVGQPELGALPQGGAKAQSACQAIGHLAQRDQAACDRIVHHLGPDGDIERAGR